MRLAALTFALFALAWPALAEEPAPPAASPEATTDTAAPPATAAEPATPGEMPAQPATPIGPRVLIQTSMGDITLQLDSVHAPKTVANFVRYAKEHHFDGTVIYRVEPGFVIQAGSWDAHVNYRPAHKPIPLESGLPNKRGTIAMARGEPDSATAEFFINLADNTPLDADPAAPPNTTGYAVFGEVTDGMDVVDKISVVPRGDNGPMKGAAPVDPITIIKVSVLPDTAP
ncbi:MAG: peptidylprolyl isomerase [Proteobacteria bacterium]|nr:peptidylprolyl isomerase [Pseudomonadota bacterium]